MQPIREKKRSRVRAGGGHSLVGTGSRALLLSSLGMRETISHWGQGLRKNLGSMEQGPDSFLSFEWNSV